ncbi:uncharacterized protein AKAW2_30431A [Aspergillus luchuensis]|uniref:Uncharacterized protein n=1 Tax=Aspergillus kawachii TaxID=1069201 RepID=A0A7R7WVJ1_ASPKA|nr:uncharacterized protein AKAW2_30431A [Aspergillus luchuensis]BCR97112.1 hypothetical protein AKAW2_30431A [Aspergillus luchuensis]BCS09585.1 hypothetical protein ALUC_30402A [Aspergillus luchuensis]
MALERLSEFRTELSHIGFIGFDSAFAVIRIRPPSSPPNLIQEPRTEAYLRAVDHDGRCGATPPNQLTSHFEHKVFDSTNEEAKWTDRFSMWLSPGLRFGFSGT